VFRTSFSNSQPTRALGPAMIAKGHKKAVWITWKYAAGDEAFEGFKESYTAAGGTIIKELGLPFPNVEFQALLTEIAALKPDAVACFFAGGGAAKFMKDYAAAGLQGKIPLYGSGFLTEGVLDAAGRAANGVQRLWWLKWPCSCVTGTCLADFPCTSLAVGCNRRRQLRGCSQPRRPSIEPWAC